LGEFSIILVFDIRFFLCYKFFWRGIIKPDLLADTDRQAHRQALLMTEKRSKRERKSNSYPLKLKIKNPVKAFFTLLKNYN